MQKNSSTKLTRLTQVALLTSGLTLGGIACAASPISYDQAGLRYINQHLDDSSCHQDGLQLNGTKDLNGDLFVLASLTDVSGDNGCGSNTLALGAGVHTVFGADSSLYGTLSYENTSVDHGTGDSGLVVAAGIRGFVRPQLEARVELAYHTEFDGNTLISGGADYWFNPNLAATGEASLGSDSNSLAVGIRFNF